MLMVLFGICLLLTDGNARLGSKCPSELRRRTSVLATRSSPTTSDTGNKLPGHIKPIYYDIILKPYIYNGQPSTFTFDGYVKIKLRCMETSMNITLHVNNLMISRKTMQITESNNGTAPTIMDVVYDTKRQLMIIKLDDAVYKGFDYFFSVRYSAKLSNNLFGFYYSKYEYGNETRYMASTQLEPAFARSVFPCFDEPEYKAHFNMTVIRSTNVTALSNMPIELQMDVGDNLVSDFFESTPIMSPHLLAVVVGEKEGIEAVTPDNVTFSAWITRGSVDKAKFALIAGMAISNYFGRYFGFKYPLPKQDIIAVPDFDAQGMENWGLIICSEDMLINHSIASSEMQQHVAILISHELAHQWFGNLVTMNWWTDLWLSEGFAEFLGWIGTSYLFPEWKMFDQFVLDIVHSAFEMDGLTTSHPVNVPVSNVDQISDIFDDISYKKAASIIRMVNFFLGENIFRRGLQRYLKGHAFGTATHDDLWLALNEEANLEGKNINVKEIMDTWTLQMNYPVVKIKRQDTSGFVISQRRFLKDPCVRDSRKYSSDFKYRWEIPFTFTTKEELYFNQDHSDIIWVTKKIRNKLFRIKAVYAQKSNTTSCNWILGNIQQYGFYRVNYDTENWKCLLLQLETNHTVIPAVHRAQIIDDSWSLASADMLDLNIALISIHYIIREMEYIPYKVAQKQFDFVDNILYNTAIITAWQDYIVSQIKSSFNVLTKDNSGSSHVRNHCLRAAVVQLFRIIMPGFGKSTIKEKNIDRLLRSSIVSTACKYGLQECILTSKYLFKMWMKDPENYRIDPDLKSTIYCTAVKHGKMKEYKFAFNQYKSSKSESEKNLLLNAMACTKSQWLLGRYLSAALDNRHIRKSDTLKVFMHIASISANRNLVWEFITKNWDQIFKNYNGSPMLAKTISTVTNGMKTIRELDDVEDFLFSHPDLGNTETVFHQATEKIQFNIRWIHYHYETLEKYLKVLKFL
ncbi:hypothetical protein LOTGIDRAFT_238560 [Lottia gigantea]|uniref:Aminopeptidase n=1 Tax=Lottia gigantea TaxID=225164 RepID=V4CEL3_LOTGI|nr:hypothetical protein LOTGIDRAFT_238560 [Lottia gigantea]ESP00390.1 hypothetical protein LOTGIDRAFT_238560 [Lottia gigantea]